MIRKLVPLALVLASLAAVTAMAATGKAVVKTHNDATLGKLLVNAKGRTLYHLNGETSKHFMCTGSACTGLWPPLTVKSRSAIKHQHVKHLGVVRRPDNHKLQVTYKGWPVYRFANDHHAGDTNGEGFAGIWHAVVVKKPVMQQTTPPPPSYTPPPGY